MRNLKWNGNIIQWEVGMASNEETIADCMTNRFLHNLVLSPTRENSLLDLLLTNDPAIFGETTYINNIAFSDHKLVNIEIVLNVERQLVKNLYSTKIPLLIW